MKRETRNCWKCFVSAGTALCKFKIMGCFKIIFIRRLLYTVLKHSEGIERVLASKWIP